MLKKRLYLVLTLILIGLVPLPAHAQDDPWPTINALLDQVDTALQNGNLVAAQSLVVGVNVLLTADLAAECPAVSTANALLTSITTAPDIPTAQALFDTATTALAECPGAAVGTGGIGGTGGSGGIGGSGSTTGTGDQFVNPPAVISNTEWTPVFYEFDEIQMAMVPPGCFTMGDDDGDRNESPEIEFCFEEAFWIDVTEVTNSQFGGRGDCGFSDAGDEPRNCLQWRDARDFCASRGGSLPTEAQWEYAIGGPDDLDFPWGDVFLDDNLVFNDNSNNEAATVGSRPLGVSWVGAQDMLGNVWEWTSTIYNTTDFPYPYVADDGREILNADESDQRVIRGGAFNTNPFFLRSGVRQGANIDAEDGTVGFRCVLPLNPEIEEEAVAPTATPAQ